MSSMGKEASLDGLEFDGETVLCRVCGDKASGFHYGVHACEGCKGFFRRSIQQKIQYRPCLKNQQCNIMRVNRNRCQYCRLKKCISVGMSRDAVRFGRVPKKEKARIIEQMQKVNLQSLTVALSNILQNEQDVIQAVINSHRITCEFPICRVQKMRDCALQASEFVNCPAHMACPLNNQLGMDSNANKHDWEDFSESFTPAIKSVVDFAKGIPGFILLNQDDQVTLLKAGTFEVLLVRLACLFDPETSTMMFTGGKLFKRHSSPMPSGAGFLLDSMFDFAERFNRLNLSDDELALFSAVVLLSPDRPGLRNTEQVERIQNKLTEGLQNMINTSHKEDSTLFAKLLMKTTDLRTLNTLHSEKSIAGQNGSRIHQERHSTEEIDMDFQDTQSIRSGRSSPAPSETSSNMTVASGSYSGDTASLDGSSGTAVIGQRIPIEAAAHQQVVLRTPYGTFYREETSGFYGMIPDQPRRRCNTLDRDTLSRPRLHTIEEGNRRRYTLDREYINKMVNKLSDRLEKRAAIRGDSMPPSISSSAASSPIPEENYPYLNSNREFIPISTADSSLCSSRASPLLNPEGMLPFGSSPNSPRPRSRSGSFGADDYPNMRPRCYSFHINSEGRASRVSFAPKMYTDRERISPESQQYLSPEIRRGSISSSYGLHARKKSLIVDRHPSYLSVTPDSLLHEEKRGHTQEMANLKRMMMHEQGLYNAAMGRPSARHSSLYPPQTSVIGVSPPPPILSRISPREEQTIPKSPQNVPMPILSKESDSSKAEFKMTASGTSAETRATESKSTASDEESTPEIFHKKFDKMRKHQVYASNAENEEWVSFDVESTMEESEKSKKDTGTEETSAQDMPKKSAGEAHPNLLAHLKSPSQVIVQQLCAPSQPQLWAHPAQGFAVMPPKSQGSISKEASQGLTINSTSLNHVTGQSHSPKSSVSSAFVQNGGLIEQKMMAPLVNDIGSKEQFHAAAVSHLKDKLMRKFDSMENLQKISKETTNQSENKGKQSLVSMPSSGSSLQMPPSSAPSVFVPQGYPPAMYHSIMGGPYPPACGVGLPATFNPHLSSMHQFAQIYANGGPPAPVPSPAASVSSAKRNDQGQPLNLTVKAEESQNGFQMSPAQRETSASQSDYSMKESSV